LLVQQLAFVIVEIPFFAKLLRFQQPTGNRWQKGLHRNLNPLVSYRLHLQRRRTAGRYQHHAAAIGNGQAIF